MKKALKVIGYVTLGILLFCASIALYIFREQEIDIGLIPNEFTYCGNQIYGDDEKYKEIVSWLKNNKTGWELSFASYVPGNVYKAGAFKVNVLSNVVVVSYKTDSGYPQFVKTGKHQLSINCEKDS